MLERARRERAPAQGVFRWLRARRVAPAARHHTAAVHRTDDLDKVAAAARRFLAKQRGEPDAEGDQTIISPRRSASRIVVEPTEDLHRPQDALIAAVAPDMVKTETPAAFFSDEGGQDIQPFLVDSPPFVNGAAERIQSRLPRRPASPPKPIRRRCSPSRSRRSRPRGRGLNLSARDLRHGAERSSRQLRFKPWRRCEKARLVISGRLDWRP